MMTLPRLVDVKVACGKVYRYQSFQWLDNERQALNLGVGDTLPKYNSEEFDNPCDCTVTEVTFNS